MKLTRNVHEQTKCEQFEVEFLHRTVKDYLREHYMSELRALISTEFNELTCRARLTLILTERVQLSDSVVQKVLIKHIGRAWIGRVLALLFRAWADAPDASAR
jgi:hypothetical protein